METEGEEPSWKKEWRSNWKEESSFFFKRIFVFSKLFDDRRGTLKLSWMTKRGIFEKRRGKSIFHFFCRWLTRRWKVRQKKHFCFCLPLSPSLSLFTLPPSYQLSFFASAATTFLSMGYQNPCLSAALPPLNFINILWAASVPVDFCWSYSLEHMLQK